MDSLKSLSIPYKQPCYWCWDSLFTIVTRRAMLFAYSKRMIDVHYLFICSESSYERISVIIYRAERPSDF